MPPPDWLHGFPYVATEIGAVRCLFTLGVLKTIPSHGSITYRDLSGRLELHQDVVERLCRFTSTFGFLESSNPESVEHSATSKLAIDNAAGLGFNIGHFPESAYLMSNALLLDSNAGEPSTCGFALAHRHACLSKDLASPRPLWRVLEADPEMAAAFASCMQFVNQSSQLGGGWVQDAFGWYELPPGATIVDVGGGTGHVMLDLAEKFPHLTYIVQDRSELIGELYHNNFVEDAVVSFMAHDFFAPQPVRADIFFFRKVFHNWSDAYCQQILRALNPALQSGAKLVINDIILPEPKGHPDYAEYVARRMDMVMMVMVNGKQRSLDQWQTLVCGSESRWQLESVEIQEGSVNGLLVFKCL